MWETGSTIPTWPTKATLLQSMGRRVLRPGIEAAGAMLSAARRAGIWDVATRLRRCGHLAMGGATVAWDEGNGPNHSYHILSWNCWVLFVNSKYCQILSAEFLGE